MAPVRPAARMQPVEVLEEGLPDTGARWRHAPPADEEVPPGAAPPARDDDGGPAVDVPGLLRRWWPVPVALVVAVTAVGVLGVQRDRERAERLAGVPGVVRPLDGPPEVLWSTPAGPGDQLLVARGLLVVVQPRTSAWHATAHDARTGEQRWSADVAPAPGAAMESGPVRCPDPGTDVGAVVVCLAAEPDPVYADDPDGTVTSGDVGAFSEVDVALPETRVGALSASDGRTLGSWTLLGELVAAGRAGDDVVVVTIDDDEHVVVARRDGVTGEVRWGWRSPVPIRGTSMRALTSVEVTRDLVVVAGSATRVLAVADGAELTAAPDFSFLRVEPLRAGFGTWSPARGGAVHDTTGAVTATVPGLPAPLAVDDGSEPRLVVLDAGNAVVAHDAATGEERWRATTALDPALVVDHRLVVVGASRYGVVDARTGAEVWDEELGAPLPWQPVTDGALVLGPGLAPDGATHLVGRGVPDGVRYWSVPVPPDTRRVRAVAGHLVLTTADEHRALG
ncbi:PQQ-binding-like beta-propeller repeat protein [Cellulomonas cellasea]|uniref:Outer membrane protein assembly factor BamB n=1 Tax=Cellulomonas cellasea TaxID=43670 RepID=A0A7W4UC08_9CELL|nr:PQQ-binding-like beta-propeller repeat protein [Cellulomonas cellasea]MBB2921418.1 outer membrane protein assembly factor BamB [Cellulomonas cellasea]